MADIPSRYGISGTDVRIAQYLDFAKPDFIDLPYLLVIQFADVSIWDSQKEIFKGPVIVRFEIEPTPAALAVFNRLLHPFEGLFGLVVSGRVKLQDGYAELFSESQILSTNIQPHYPHQPDGFSVTIDPLTGVVG